MNEIELHQKKMRGIKAKQLLDDELIKMAINDIREGIFKQIASSAFNEKEEREDAYRMLRAVECFEGQLKRHINTGRAAEEELGFAGKIVKRIQEL
jgi:hypothetical protein